MYVIDMMQRNNIGSTINEIDQLVGRSSKKEILLYNEGYIYYWNIDIIYPRVEDIKKEMYNNI